MFCARNSSAPAVLCCGFASSLLAAAAYSLLEKMSSVRDGVKNPSNNKNLLWVEDGIPARKGSSDLIMLQGHPA
ncbi:hypothetical protein CUU66_12735 [Peribacillus deserti]|uniref:Uncharacterized protein n=1 Tax=Peribacillus deserti TaxID=673318 RepID=A0A2N5M5E1_9BACI|nr:hypothetical protein CUU66_12735 [Peribacillus deserti]